MEIPYGYCHCGCGEKTKISNWNDKRYGSVKGEPRKYLNGHSTKVPAIKRFWKYIAKTYTCWEWVGHRDGGGYGVLSSERKLWKAHRFSWTILKGPIPVGMKVLHKCDNPRCVNPDHLFLGTQLDNMRDCADKGRIKTTPRPGELNSMAVLTQDKVLEMRKLRETSNMPHKKIAILFGVSTMTAYRAIVKQSWGHL